MWFKSEIHMLMKQNVTKNDVVDTSASGWYDFYRVIWFVCRRLKRISLTNDIKSNCYCEKHKKNSTRILWKYNVKIMFELSEYILILFRKIFCWHFIPNNVLRINSLCIIFHFNDFILLWIQCLRSNLKQKFYLTS